MVALIGRARCWLTLLFSQSEGGSHLVGLRLIHGPNLSRESRRVNFKFNWLRRPDAQMVESFRPDFACHILAPKDKVTLSLPRKLYA